MQNVDSEEFSKLKIMEGSCDTEWDVDKYKSDHEPKHHWALRRQFMETNKGRFPEDRLAGLGYVFANIEFMGCRYPKETMELVEELAFGVVQEYREQQKGRLQRTFVSGSTAAAGKVNRVQKRKNDDNKSEQQPAAKKFQYNMFVSAGTSSGAENDKKEEKTEYDPRQMAAMPSQMHATPSQLHKHPLPVNTGFIIVRLEYEKEENPCNVLNRSAGFCKTTVSWDIVPSDNSYRCKVKIVDNEIHSALGNTKNEARDKATQEALDLLSKKCYTILVKNKYLSAQGESIDANELSNPLNPKNDSKPTGNKTQLPASNIGHKLLQMMGWSGGGLGKGGSGISEPITAQGIVTREGFGTKNASHQFKQKIRQIVEEYAASSNPYDLVFTSGFENEQRKEIHLIAKRLGLRSKSFGKNEDRFITISRKFDAQQLIDELIQRGGSTEKYDLIAPTA